MLDIEKPRQVILVSCRHEGKDNIIALAWHMPVSVEPQLYAIAVSKKRLACEMISKSRQFVINFIPFELKEKVLYCGTHSGKDADKFKECKFDKEEAVKVKCPIIKQCSAFMECMLATEIEMGDHVIFIGEVVNSGKKNDKKRIFQTSGKEKYNFTTTVE